VALERKKEKREATGEIETEHPGYLSAQDDYYVGNIKGVGRIYLQTFVDTYSKVAFAKLYDRKNAITSADLLNDACLSFVRHPVQTGVMPTTGRHYTNMNLPQAKRTDELSYRR